MSARLPFSLIENNIAQPNPRIAILEDRVHLNWQGLREDIDRWIQTFPPDSSIVHHLNQFKLFAENLHSTLMMNFDEKISAPIQDRRIILESLVNGVLTSQWFVLRQVVQQRLPNNPYLANVLEIEEQIAGYYGRLYKALPPSAQEHVPSSPPFVYLGRITELTIFRQPGTPTIVSLPVGVLTQENDKSIGAIAHETGHAIFSCLPTFLEELTMMVNQHFSGIAANQKPLLKTILGWLEEMVADCTGTALEGLLHGESVIWLTTSPDQSVGIGSSTHPPGSLRPFIHLTMLNYLAEKFDGEKRGEKYRSDANLLERKIDIIIGDLLDRRFESIQALTIVKLGEMKTLMEAILVYILDECKLTALANMTLGDVLTTSISGDFKAAVKTRDKWGEKIAAKGDSFVLEFPVFTLDHIDPNTLQTICAWVGIRCVPAQ